MWRMTTNQLACVWLVMVSASCAGLDDAATSQPPASAPSPASGGQPPVGMPTGPAGPTAPTGPITPVVPPTVVSGTWTALTGVPLESAGFMLLLTDGTVLVSEVQSGKWFRLTPDLLGSYLHGTWSQIAKMPAGYAPLYFGAGVLPDGRVMIEGGEYNGTQQDGVWTTQGAIYDPVTNKWRSVAPPAGWTTIGDASAVVLADGTYMQSDCCSTKAALLDPRTLTWKATGAGKQGESNDEESWTVLHDGTILTVDCNNTVNLLASEIYTPATGKWTLGPNTANKTCDINPDNSGSHENGPAILRYDGTVFALGGTGHNDIYDTATKTWTAAPDSPVVPEGQLDSADGPAVLLPNGNELIVLSPGLFQPPTHMFEWDGTALSEVAAPPGAPLNTSFTQSFMLLPTGEVLLTDFTSDIEMYTPANPTPVAAAVPVITSLPALVTTAGALAEPEVEVEVEVEPSVRAAADADALPLTTLHPGRTYNVSAQRMNGLSEAVAYGDDAQPATNYPIIRITSAATSHVFYCRTFGHSNRAIGPDVVGSTNFAIPATTERGLAKLELVANGIASPAITVNIK